MNKKVILGVIGLFLVCICICALIFFFTTRALVSNSPGNNFAIARNNERQAHVNMIATALQQYMVGNASSVKKLGITTCPTYSTIGTSSNNIDLDKILVPNYIVSIPEDVNGGTKSDTKYTICISSQDEVIVRAPMAELNEIIESVK